MAIEKFQNIESPAVPLSIENVDTDQIIPARFLKATTRDGFGENLFRDWRYYKQNNPIGDFVLTGGELAAMCVIDATIRLIPGVLGNEESAVHESFQKKMLDHPHYTRPRVHRNYAVPEILLSGNHSEIKKWRNEQALKITKKKRPDLLQ